LRLVGAFGRAPAWAMYKAMRDTPAHLEVTKSYRTVARWPRKKN
jgi:hypothetical protein